MTHYEDHIILWKFGLFDGLYHLLQIYLLVEYPLYELYFTQHVIDVDMKGYTGLGSRGLQVGVNLAGHIHEYPYPRLFLGRLNIFFIDERRGNCQYN